MSAATLRAALAVMGLDAMVEAEEQLAVIIPECAASARSIAAVRGDIVRLATAHGFSHVALAVEATVAGANAKRDDAAVSGD